MLHVISTYLVTLTFQRFKHARKLSWYNPHEGSKVTPRMMCFFLDYVLVDLHPYFFLKHEGKLHLLKINTKKFWPGHLFWLECPLYNCSHQSMFTNLSILVTDYYRTIKASLYVGLYLWRRDNAYFSYLLLPILHWKMKFFLSSKRSKTWRCWLCTYEMEYQEEHCVQLQGEENYNINLQQWFWCMKGLLLSPLKYGFMQLYIICHSLVWNVTLAMDFGTLEWFNEQTQAQM